MNSGGDLREEYLERDRQHALLVEFSDDNGQTYALIPVRPGQLLVLHRKAEAP